MTALMGDALLALAQGATPERVIWTGDLTYWMFARACEGTADHAWDTEEGYLAFHQDLGILPCLYYPKFSAARTVDDATVQHDYTQDGHRRVWRIRTPLGEICEESLFLPASCSTGVVKHFVESAADLDVLRYLVEHRRLEPCNLDDYHARLAMWSLFDGVPLLGMPRAPLAALLTEWAGVEQGTYLLMDHEEAVRDLFDSMEAAEAPVVEAVCALQPPIIHFPDNLSSDNLGGLYDAWLAPTHQRRIARFRAAGVATAVHLDGTVRGLLPKLAASGFTAVEALTPAPVGDMPASEMRAVAGSDRLILWGGVPGAMFAPPYTWDDMETHIMQVLDAWQGTPFVLGVADQVPPDGDITFCRRIAEMLETTDAA